MKKNVRSFVIAAVLVSIALGTLCLAAPTPSPDRQTRLYCGGEPGGNACPEGYVCVDLGDYCNPRHGGADCLGYCKPQRP
jgi:hypothetical protein